MKRKLRLLGISCLALFLSLVMLVSSVLAAEPQKSAAEHFDYGLPGNTTQQTVSASELLQSLLGTSISDVERIYLDELSGISLRYSNLVPDSSISTVYDRDNGVLTVTAQPHRYTASNGAIVEWIPTEATLDGKTLALQAGESGYSCRFDGIMNTGDFHMDVQYSWKVSFSQDAVEALMNAAYAAGSEALEEVIAYEIAYADYTAKREAYEAYENYKAQKLAFAQYELDMIQYNKDYDAFLDYDAKNQKYLQEKAVYDAWQAYWAYDSFVKNHLEEFVQNQNDYAIYKNQMDLMKARLRPLENLFVTDSHGWQLYGSLMGTLVSLVLIEENKALLITGGCNSTDVNNAGVAAVALRELMSGYASVRNAKYNSEHDRTVALYRYYLKHFEALKANFSQLCTSLNTLCDNTALIIKLDVEGKLLHYRQFIGQLYVTATCLDDSVKRDPEWTVNKKPLEVAVEACNIVPDDIIARPNEKDIPTKEIVPMKEVPYAEMPDGEQPRVPPTKPTPEVPEPKKPTYVANPDLGVIPPPAEDPGDPPTALAMDARLRAVAEAVRGDKLKSRDFSQARNTAFSATASVKRLVSVDNRKLITFLAGDGQTVLRQITVEYGEDFMDQGIDTVWPADAQYSYTFEGWRLADGTRPEFIAYSDMTLIASYIKQTRAYTVTWILNDSVKSFQYNYGTLPKDPFLSEITLQPEEGYQYIFSGWSPEITPVTGDVTYRATRIKEPLLYTVTWDLGDRLETREVPFGEYPVYEGTPTRAPDEYLYTFAGWETQIVRVDGNVTYRAKFTKTPLALATDKTVYNVTHTDAAVIVDCTKNLADVREAVAYAKQHQKMLTLRWEAFSISVAPENLDLLLTAECRRVGFSSVSQNEQGIAEMTFTCFDLFGNPYASQLPFVLHGTGYNEGSSTHASALASGAWQEIASEGVACTGTVSLRVASVFNIDVTANGSCNLSAIPLNAPVGTLIDLRAECALGYEVSGAYVVTASGATVPVHDLTFYMPNDHVNIRLTVSKIVYEVIFRVDGEEILRGEYGLLEQIQKPEGRPTKASDDQYDYTFVSWSQDISIAWGDERTLIFDAVFEASPKTVGNPYHSGNNNNFTLTVVVPIVGSVLLLGIGTLIFYRIRRKRKKLALKAAKAAEADAVKENVEDGN